MPLYEYECAACGKRFELIQKFSDPTEAACTACGGAAKRLLSASAVHFKGSGWYATDYARQPTPAEKGDGKPEIEKKPETASDSKKETRSDAATPAAKQSD